MAKSPPLLVAIVGGSGSGKTWLAEKLQTFLGRKAARLSLDDFYRDRSHLPASRRAGLNFDHPRAIDWVSFERVLRDLRAGRATRVPRYDFTTHCRLPRGKVLKPNSIILVDGLWLLHRAMLRVLFGARIFIECSFRTRLQRRLSRDLLSRGRSAASVRAQFKRTVEPMHRRFVAPQVLWANIILQGSCDKRQVAKIASTIREQAARGSGLLRP